MLLTGYTTSFHEQPVHIREAILDGWRLSYLPTLNLIHKQMTTLAKNIWLKSSPVYRSLSGVPEVPELVITLFTLFFGGVSILSRVFGKVKKSWGNAAHFWLSFAWGKSQCSYRYAVKAFAWLCYSLHSLSGDISYSRFYGFILLF